MLRLSTLVKMLIVTIGFLCSFAAFAAQDGSANEIRIGQIVSLTGPAAPFGIPERDTVKYQVEQANKDGGIDGHRIVLFVEDDQSNPTVAAKAARELIVEKKVNVIIGPTTGTMSFAVGPIAARYKIPFLVPQGTATVTNRDTGFYDWIFRVSITDKIAVADAISYMKKNGYKRVGLFFQQDAYGKAAAKLFRELADQHHGIEIVAEASAQLNASNLSVQATKLLTAHPDVIFVQSDSVSAGAAILRAFYQKNSTVPVVVSAGMGMQAFINAAGPAAEGVVSIGSIGWDKPTPEQARFIQGYGQPKGFSEALAGTGFLAVKGAVKNIKGEITGSSIRDALEQLCHFPTLIGSDGCYSPSDHDGDMHGVNLKVVDGKWVTIGSR